MTQHRVIASDEPLRLLVLCTRNSARSQMAEALLAAEGGASIVAASAGSDPGPGVHPLAVDALAELGIDWGGRPAQGIDAVSGLSWDAVITVCDAARDACPFMPGATLSAHWGLEDPAAVRGARAAQLQAFRVTRDALHRAVRALLTHVNEAPEASRVERLRQALDAGHAALSIAPLIFPARTAE